MHGNINHSGKTPSTSLTGVILVGGKSKRMGFDKVEMVLGSKRVLPLLVESLASVCDEIIFAGRELENLPLHISKKWRGVKDLIPERGPLAGVLSAMNVCSNEYLLVIPADMPFLNSELFKIYMKDMHLFDALISPYRGFPVLLKTSLKVCLEGYLKREELCFFDAVENCARKLKVLEVDEVRKIGDPEIIFFNVNSPEDFYFADKLFTVLGM